MLNSETRSLLNRSLRNTTLTLILLADLWAPPVQAALPYKEQGRLHDPSSWRSDEFKRDWGLQAIGADYGYARGLSGKGVRIAIYDSGTDLRHREFAGKGHRGVRMAEPGCLSEANLSPDTGCFFTEGDRTAVTWIDLTPDNKLQLEKLIASGTLTDDFIQIYSATLGKSIDDHGTHVAGTMVANRDGSAFHGVAYNSSLSAIRYATHEYYNPPSANFTGRAQSLAAITGAYAQLRQDNVRVINHSWGPPVDLESLEVLDADLAAETGVLGNALGQGSRDFGLLQVWAAGNNRKGQNTSPETALFADTLPSMPRARPELEPYWLSVVNLNQSLTLDSSSFRCGYSMNWCLAAPGTGIISSIVSGEIDTQRNYGPDTKVNGFTITADRPVFGYGSQTGTSMAAPHVSGALALLMERFPYLDNPQIRDVLLTTARDLGAPGVDEVYGWGLIDLKKGIDGPGQLRVDTNVVMNQRAGGAKIWQGGAWDDWRNDISGPGRLGKSGPGWLRLSGNNSFAGATLTSGTLEFDGVNRLSRDIQVNGGLLRLNGSLQGTDLNLKSGSAHINGQQHGGQTLVGAGALLSGDGMLANTRVEGTIVPGSELRPLTVNGTYVQAAGSNLVARVGLNNANVPALKTTGLASIEGGTLRLTRGANGSVLGQQYRVLQADGGVTGAFSTIDRQQFSPFLGFTQRLNANALMVDVGRGLPLASVARTPNQRATATAADNLSLSQPLAQRLTSLFPAQAPEALDQLSGELHASTQGVMLENSRGIRDAALERARSTPRTDDPQAGTPRSGVWVQLPHKNGRLDSDRTTSNVSYSSTGLLIGIDHVFEQGTQAGMLLGSSRGDVKAGGRGKASIDTYQTGLYLGHTWDAFGLYGGLSYANNQIQSKRQVGFPGVNEQLAAKYNSRTGQLFIESNFRLEQGALEWQPYVQLAHIRSRNDGFNERGGISALKGKSSTNSVNLATGGVLFKLDMAKTQTGPAWLSFNGGLAYTRASGDLTPAVDVAWQDASTMHITGAPLNSTALKLNLGAVARLTRSSSGSVNLSDQRGERSQERSVSAQYQFEF